MITEYAAAQWDLELDDLFLTTGHRFGRAELRRRMRNYVRGLLAPVARKNSWQLAEQADRPTPDGLQRLLAGSKWEPRTSATTCSATSLTSSIFMPGRCPIVGSGPSGLWRSISRVPAI
ncbi:hypothetical protein ACFW6Q_04365 [Streptomyces sp. NPDC058737]|uniref:hypothetical protein n=1 Tax=Streptomyces sp. NPDC058737 TaxID=3346617 RepID=UPI00367FDB32